MLSTICCLHGAPVVIYLEHYCICCLSRELPLANLVHRLSSTWSTVCCLPGAPSAVCLQHHLLSTWSTIRVFPEYHLLSTWGIICRLTGAPDVVYLEQYLSSTWSTISLQSMQTASREPSSLSLSPARGVTMLHLLLFLCTI